jgi:hypothetical protein
MLHETMLYGYAYYRYWNNSGCCCAPVSAWME